MSHLAHEVGYSCDSDIWQLLDGQEKKNKEDHLILMFKVLQKKRTPQLETNV